MPAFALVVHMIIAAGSYPVLSFVARAYPPAGVLALRATLGALLLLGAVVVRGAAPWPPRREMWRFLLVGVAGVPVNQGFLLYGLQTAQVSHAAILYAMTPVFVAITARLWLRERLGRWGTLGVLLSLLGALVVLKSRAAGTGSGAGTGILGDLSILVGVVGWVVYTVMSRPLVLRYGVLPVTAWAHAIGAITAWPLGGLALAKAGWPPGQVLAGIVWLAVALSFINYLIWNYALFRLKTAAVAVSSNLQPPLAALLAWVIGHEQPTWLLGVGGLLVLTGVTLTLTRRPPPATNA
jgi:drug/metabolite transporter (DMT)-like permease